MKLGSIVRYILALISVLTVFIGLKISVEEIDYESIVMADLYLKEIEYGIEFQPVKINRDDIYVLFLPSFYKNSNPCFGVTYNDKKYRISIDGESLRTGDLWNDDLKEQIHSLIIKNSRGKVLCEKKMQVLVSEKLPTIMVEVEAKNALLNTIDYANKQYIEKGSLTMYDETGELLISTDMDRFKIRGNLTAELAKKPFTFTLPSAVSLCGMERAKNWHLIANYTDGSHLRNKIMLDWASEISTGYHPEGEFVEVYLNGEYNGLYLLTETVEVGENRLNIGPGQGYLLEMDIWYRAVEEENCIITNQGHYFVVHTEQYLSEENKNKIREILNDIESALYSTEGISNKSGKSLEELIDFDSWTDTWLLKEVSSDHDLGVVSQYLYIEDLEEKSIVMAGPEWDFDGTLGNGMVPWSCNPRMLVTALHNVKGINSVSQNKWLAPMYLNEKFQNLLIEKFEHEIEKKVKKLVTEEIDNYLFKIKRATLLDSVRWNGNDNQQYFAFPKNFNIPSEGDYHKYDVVHYHIDTIKHFLREKETFLRELWIEKSDFEVLVEERNGEGMNLELNNNIYTWIKKEETK